MNDFITGQVVKAQVAANEKAVAIRDEETGATAVEYGIMVAGIAALVMAVVFVLGGEIRDLFQRVVNQI